MFRTTRKLQRGDGTSVELDVKFKVDEDPSVNAFIVELVSTKLDGVEQELTADENDALAEDIARTFDWRDYGSED